jgi:membrane protein DedA with SNARE-associated domain
LELSSFWTGIPLSTTADSLTDEGGLIGLVARIIDALGYPGIALLIALESIVPPIPSEAILPMAGFLAADGTFSLWGVLISATIGSLIGALGLYLAGWWLGRSRLLTIVDRFGGKVGLSMNDLNRAEAWFKKHGRISVLIGRLVPIIRSLVSIPAGFAKMPLKQFVAFTAIGSIIYSRISGNGWAPWSRSRSTRSSPSPSSLSPDSSSNAARLQPSGVWRDLETYHEIRSRDGGSTPAGV